MLSSRYQRQSLLPQIGHIGQERLAAARVALVGCGALGCGVADQLARAGVGALQIIDRDVLEETNLQRQVLFDERDVEQGLPKAIAAANRLGRVNREVQVEPIVADFHAGNGEELLGLRGEPRAPQVIIDGTDNAETRYLINDIAVKHHLPWVYGGCVGTEGRMMAVRPGRSPCLRCLFPDPPAAGTLATCDTVGILGMAASAVASLQAVAAIAIILDPVAGGGDAAAQPSVSPLLNKLVSMNLWSGYFHDTPLERPHAGCPCCGGRQYPFLESRSGQPVALCGRNAIQVQPRDRGALDLGVVAARLKAVGEVEVTQYFLRCRLGEPGEVRLTLFPDGRLIVHGARSVEQARSVYARYIGV